MFCHSEHRTARKIWDFGKNLEFNLMKPEYSLETRGKRKGTISLALVFISLTIHAYSVKLKNVTRLMKKGQL